LFNLYGHFKLLFLVLSTALYAQSFQDFKKVQIQLIAQQKNKQEALYSKYLLGQWQEYTPNDALRYYISEKPNVLDFKEERQTLGVGPRIHIKLPKYLPEQQQFSQLMNSKKIEFTFYGVKLHFNTFLTIQNANFFPHNQEGVVHYFDAIAQSDYLVYKKELEIIKERLRLNDWGIYLLVKQLAIHIYKKEAEVKLFTWFMLGKMGYDVKIGLKGMRIVLMFYSKKHIYNMPYCSFGKKKYYIFGHELEKKKKTIYSYAKIFPGATKPLDLLLDKLPKFPYAMEKKSLSFQEYGHTYTIPYEYNKNIIDFMSTYPSADYKTYFQTPMNQRSYLSLAKGLKKYIEGKHTSRGIEFILHFIQKAFQYKKDMFHFGREKVMFAQETLYYNYSDSDDRAVLFSYLINKLFGIRVIGLKYKNHMATALYIPMQGETVSVGKRKFVLADPSYLNANIGDIIPKYKLQKVEKILFFHKEH